MEEMQVSCRGPNGFVMDPLTHFRPDPSLISEDCWAVAEETIQEMMNCIHPNLDSEEKRKDVIEYIQRLLRCSLGCEVFPYGSVPLKTYLPDGDIDLTVLGSQNIEESFAHEVIAVLQEEEINENVEYDVKDTQFINAEVKLVKCLVQNIVIDISFNQLGGLSKLCFLEQVDRLAGKNHLFKRSIILIKAWCYYESRILGAHHGLISTYALETLVLYIFHIFHSSLNGPLAVLYRFLDYFCKFDWENYCISLNGPVCKSSLPYLVAERPENGGADLMLTEEFLRNCMDMFSVPSSCSETNSRAFPQKHLNIIDPLKDNNNLGRSVHRGNFYRIRSAFKYGARKLGWILSLPKERISDEIKKFFSNTLERHGRKYVIDIRNSALFFEVSDILSLSSQTESLSDDESQSKSSSSSVDNENLGIEQSTLISRHELDRCSIKLGSSQRGSETCYATDGTSVSGGCLSGDANDLANSRSLSSRNGNDTSDCSLLSSNCSSCLCGSFMENGKSENRGVGYNNSSSSIDEKLAFDSWMEHTINFSMTSNTVQSCISSGSAISSADSNFPGLSLDFREIDLTCISGDMDTINPLSDLSGDYDSHIRSLLYAHGCNSYALASNVLPKRATSPYPFQRNKSWDVVTLPLNQNSGSKKSINGVAVTPPSVFANSIPCNAAFGLEEQHKAQGMGTYLHHMNSCSCREKPSRGRGSKSQETRGQLQIRSHSNGMTPAVCKRNSVVEYSHEDPSAYYPDKAYEKHELSLQSQISSNINTLANGLSDAFRRLEFGTLGRLPEVSSLFTSGSSYDKISVPPLSLEMNGSKPITSKKGRVADQLLHLKNEDEFPPLSL